VDTQAKHHPRPMDQLVAHIGLLQQMLVLVSYVQLGVGAKWTVALEQYTIVEVCITTQYVQGITWCSQI